jgi:hypothetical protein
MTLSSACLWSNNFKLGHYCRTSISILNMEAATRDIDLVEYSLQIKLKEAARLADKWL